MFYHTDMMTLEEFEHKAQLYVVASLEPDELEAFTAARQHWGFRAEQLIAEAHELAMALALSLQPQKPHPAAKDRLLNTIRASLRKR